MGISQIFCARKMNKKQVTQTQTQHKIKNVFIRFDLFCFGNFQNKTLISLNENGIHLHISNELSIPNYNIQNFKEWKC